ncbi:hypothetical protein [Phocoenobacter atlanticus]|uniref:hypothetical protein n=1 Tax=Phocoenobacter atlanticus TaxID=3416742 RepID=UPI0027717504|nr:hypothetical protein [Pasteurella atlantica]MDP8101721.1 hypothetical protein [Pasteurella atlantica]
MELLSALGVVILIYSVCILGSYLVSRRKLTKLKKDTQNVIRQITEEEQKYLTPYLKLCDLSLFSHDVYQLDDVEVVSEDYRHKGVSILKTRVNGIDILFPEPLENFLNDRNNIGSPKNQVGKL